MSQITPTRVWKSLSYRTRRGIYVLRSLKPKRFASTADLREHALRTTTRGNRFSYSVRVPKGERSSGVQLRLGRIKSAKIIVRRGRLIAHVALTSTRDESEVAWAVASLAQTALRPTAFGSRDVVVDGSLDPALAMGHRLALGGFGETERTEMELTHARHVTSLDSAVPYFDLAQFNPIGLRLRENSHRLPGIHIDLDSQSAASALRTLRKASTVQISGGDAASIAALAATGRIVHIDRQVPGLNPELLQVLSQPLPKATTDPESVIELLMRSEKQRRLAMLHHAGAWRLQDSWPSASIVLATKRAHLLPAALRQAAEQTYPNFEVIVGLHDIPASSVESQLREAQDLLGQRLRVIHFGPEQNLGEMYAAMTQASDGAYIAKFDDDDLYGIHHLWDSIISMRYSGAAMIGRAPTVTWLDESAALLMRTFGQEERYSPDIGGPTIVASKAAILECGGWRPTPSAVDTALKNRFLQHGAAIYSGGQLGWVYVRHDEGHTWVRGEDHFRSQSVAEWGGQRALDVRDKVLGHSQVS